MYTLGSGFMPSANHAGGLRYHGMSPILSKLYHDGYLDEARSVEQTKVFRGRRALRQGWKRFCPRRNPPTRSAAPSTKRISCKETGEKKTILFGLTGTGYFDMTAYTAYLERHHDGLHSHRRGSAARLRQPAADLTRQPPPCRFQGKETGKRWASAQNAWMKCTERPLSITAFYPKK